MRMRTDRRRYRKTYKTSVEDDEIYFVSMLACIDKCGLIGAWREHDDR